MGFDCVLIAPPFLPGLGGNIFLTGDHTRLHPALGSLAATEALAQIVIDAQQENLRVMLDLVIDRVAVDARIVDEHPTWFRSRTDLLPDPRRPTPDRAAAAVWFPNTDLVPFWQARMAEWLDAGISGFRCDATDHVPPFVWESLIAAARRRQPHVTFLASALGADPSAVAQLTRCGFDLAVSSVWAWNFRSDWLDDDACRTNAIGALTAMPELPFGARLTDHVARRRALQFAAAYGEAWLMPMGFEFGASTPLDPVSDRPDDLRALLQSPDADLEAEVAAANALHRDMAGYGIGTTISAPASQVAAIRRVAPDGKDDRLILVNACLDRTSEVPIRTLRPRLGCIADFEPGPPLPPGGVRVLTLPIAQPVVLPRRGARAVEAATRAPRIAIEDMEPCVDGGRFAVRRGVGDTVEVQADLICDGHETLAAALLWRPSDMAEWNTSLMQPEVNDRWCGRFLLQRIGRYLFTVEVWVDVYGGFRAGLQKKRSAGVDLTLELQEGRQLIADAARRSGIAALQDVVSKLDTSTISEQIALLLAEPTARLMAEADVRPCSTRHAPVLVEAERRAAAFASWYELFPRSESNDRRRHGTFADVIARLPAIRAMGFDVLYFPPIHPIGTTHRKGRNNALRAEPGDPGSPYAIGAAEGGHDAILPALGTLQDFRHLISRAQALGLEIALDFAIQCSPDHPWLREHPDWFEWRSDGSVRYAENPPKIYEDIVNVAFYADGARPSLWLALHDVVLFWVHQGVRIFRVDNPHTKPLPFWEWMITAVRTRHPDVIFLAEAFTRPKMMYRLAKLGFSQSYTYFTWRNTAAEMREYLIELTTTPVREFFRPHFFVNTPDINPEFLQRSGRAGFLIRAMLAATLSGLWGMYSGFELCEAAALPGREEYLDSEKYQLRARDWTQPGNIIAEITALNRIRRSNPALHSHLGIRFLPCSSERMLCFVKATKDFDNVLVLAVSFDPGAAAEADIFIPPDALGLRDHTTLVIRDLIHDTDFTAQTGQHHLHLTPLQPYIVWRVNPPGQEPT
jgi:starch synthase (maltosyl-transferring)